MKMIERAPNTEEVRDVYAWHPHDYVNATPEEAAAEFDRWLAGVRREAAAQALEEVARTSSIPVLTEVGIRTRAVVDVALLIRATEIRGGGV